MQTLHLPVDDLKRFNPGFNLGRAWRNSSLWKLTPYLVAPNSRAHAAVNPSFISYSGHEIVSNDLTDGEVRAKVLEALNDMEDRFPLDFPSLNPNRFKPGTMGILITQPGDPGQGFRIDYHSSMKHNKNPDPEGIEIQLAERLGNLMIQDAGTLPVHRRNYRCTEPGLFSNSDDITSETGSTSRIYVVDEYGQFLPPCGSDLGPDEIWCAHIVDKAGAITIGDGPAATITQDSTIYEWSYAPKSQPQVSLRLPSRKARHIAFNIAAEMGKAIASSVPLQSGLEPRYLVDAIARAIASRISYGLNRYVPSEVRSGMAFEAAYRGIVEIAEKLASQLQYHEIMTVVARDIAAIILGGSRMSHDRESAQLSRGAAKKANQFASRLQYPGLVAEIARDQPGASQPFPEIALVHNYTTGVAASARDKSPLQDIRGRVLEVLQKLHDHVASRTANGLPFVEAYNEASAAAIESTPAAGAEQCQAAEDRGLLPEITSRVLAEVIPWTAQKATAPRILTSRAFVSVDHEPAPSPTTQQLREWAARREPTEYLRSMEARIRRDFGDGASPAFRTFPDGQGLLENEAE
ncbi:hypothetical protein GGR58DRAFT_526889 [Xylaria digitata]|nr:hypothetical protein GGR58DRAFT_526889 [Xylaria digitata]